MKDRKPWHEDDSFWETWGPLMFTPKRIADAVDEIDKVIKLLDIQPGSNILDLCCGIGRHSLELGSPRVSGDRCRSDKKIPGQGKKTGKRRKSGH